MEVHVRPKGSLCSWNTHCKTLREANDCVIGNELEDFIESFVEYNNLPEDWFEKSRFNGSTDNLFWEISPKLQ